MKCRYRLFACSLAIATLPRPPSAAAETPRSRVALVRSESTDRLLKDASTRVRAELTSAGFAVIEVDRPPGDARAGVEAAAGSGDSFATVALDRTDDGAFADVWISDHVTGKTLVRRLEVSADANAATVLAVRALELLRASLLELAKPPPPESEPVAPPPADVIEWMAPVMQEVRAPVERAPFSGIALGVSGQSLHGTSGLGLAFGPSLRASYGFAEPWFVRASWSGPLFGQEPETTNGQASVRQEYASLDLGLASHARPLGAYGWIGAGAFHLRTVGSSARPYRERTDSVWSFATNAGLGGLLRLNARTLVTLDLGVLLLVPYSVVMIAGDEAGTAGLPSVHLSLGVLVGL